MHFDDRLKILRYKSGRSSPEVAVRRMAARLHNEYGKADPPFLPDRFGELCAVRIEKVPLDDCDARLIPTDEGFIAEVCADHSEGRRNFSVCHEVAHTFFLPEPSSSLPYANTCLVSYYEVKFEEQLCNLAAAELLMPKRCFKSVASSYDRSLKSVWRMQQDFNTTAAATIIRLAELDIWPLIALNLEPLDRWDPGLGFAIKWWRASSSAFEKYLASDVVLSFVRSAIHSQRSLDKLGVLRCYTQGVMSEGELVIESLKKNFIMQSFKYYQAGRPCVFSIILRKN